MADNSDNKQEHESQAEGADSQVDLGGDAKPAGKDDERLCASVIKGQVCRTQKSGKQCPYSHEVPSYHKNIYVCHLPLQYTKEDLERLFHNQGKINEVKILIDPRTGKSRGVGFLHFERHEDAKTAIAFVHDMKLPNHSQPLQARFARITKQKKEGRGGGRGGPRGDRFDGRRGGGGGRRDWGDDDRRGGRLGGREGGWGRDRERGDRDRFARPRPRRDPYDGYYGNGFDDYDDYGADYRRGSYPPPPPAPRARPASYASAAPPPSSGGYDSYAPPPAQQPAYSAPSTYPSTYAPYGAPAQQSAGYYGR